jgi:hypothetical protein
LLGAGGRSVDALFEQHAQTQYTRELLFSSVVDVMSLVVCGMQPSVNAAYKHLQDRIPVARKNLYEKINHTEPAVSAALVRQTAGTMTEIIGHLGGALPELLPGRPSGGRSSPFSAGLFRMLSGVAPNGTCQRKSPVSRLIAVIRL